MAKRQNTLERPVVRERVKAFVLEGLSDAQVAEKIGGVSRQAITAFRHRHAAEIAPVIAAIEKQISDYAIAQRVKRIAAQNDRWERGQQVIIERAADPTFADVPGYSTGLLVHQRKSVGSGRDVEIVDEFAVDTGLMNELLKLETKAAEQLGDIPKGDGGASATAVVQIVNIVRGGPTLGVGVSIEQSGG